MSFNFQGERRERGIFDGLYSGSGTYLAEQAAAGWEDSAGATLWRGLVRGSHWFSEALGTKDRGKLLTPFEANQRFGTSGLKFDQPIYELDAVYDVELRKRKELRDTLLAQNTSGGFVKGLGFGAYMLANIVNPVDAALAFMPVVKVGEAAIATRGLVRAEMALAREGAAGAVATGGRWSNALRTSVRAVKDLRPTMVGLEARFGTKGAPYIRSIIDGSVGNIFADFPHLIEDRYILDRDISAEHFLESFLAGGAVAGAFNLAGHALARAVSGALNLGKIAADSGFIRDLASGAKKLIEASDDTKELVLKTATNDVLQGKPASHTDLILALDPKEIAKEAQHVEAMAVLAKLEDFNPETLRGRGVTPPVLAAIAARIAPDPVFGETLQALARDVLQEAAEGPASKQLADQFGILVDPNVGSQSPFPSMTAGDWSASVAERMKSVEADRLRDGSQTIKNELLPDGRDAQVVKSAIEDFNRAIEGDRDEFLFKGPEDTDRIARLMKEDGDRILSEVEQQFGPLSSADRQMFDDIDKAFPDLPDLSPVIQCLAANG